MSKLSRFTQLLFGSTATTNQIAKFGSYAAGSPVRYSGSTATPALIQALSNYLSGWFGAVVGGKNPNLEDRNAIDYLFSYQLAYLLQQGIPEYDAGTTYYAGSIAQDGSGNLYQCIATSTGNALTNTTYWRNISAGLNIVSINPATQSPYTVTAADNNKTFLVNTANGAMQFNMIAPLINFNFKAVDSTGSAGTNNIVFHRNAAESMEGLAADYTMIAAWDFRKIYSDGSNWFLE